MEQYNCHETEYAIPWKIVKPWSHKSERHKNQLEGYSTTRMIIILTFSNNPSALIFAQVVPTRPDSWSQDLEYLLRKGVRSFDTILPHLCFIITIPQNKDQAQSTIGLDSTPNVHVGRFWNGLDNDLIPREFIILLGFVVFPKKYGADFLGVKLITLNVECSVCHC